MTTIRFLLVTFLFSVTLPAVLAADSVESLRKKAKAGSLKAKVEIAHLSLRSQQGVEYDAEMIFKTFTQGAKANLSRAHYGLAKCYVLGVDTKPDQKLALKHAKASAKLNDPQGIRYLGNCYLYGRGMDKPDIEKGIGLLKKSIKMGNIMAEYTYAFYLTQNCKDEASNKKGLAMVNSLIKRKHPDSAHLLGMLYHDGRAGLENNREQAMKYYRMAAELNHADGFHQVGNMLLQDKKPKEAIGWLVKGVNRGSYNACWTLSKILKADPDLQEEPNQWVEYAEVAAVRGNRNAQDQVAGYYFSEADEKNKDWIKAAKFAHLAAEKGKCHCWDWLAQMYVRAEHGMKRDYTKALSCCRNHFEHGHVSTLYLAFILKDWKKYNQLPEIRIKSYAAFLSAKKRGSKQQTQAFLDTVAKSMKLSKEDIAEAQKLHEAGFPKPGCKILPDE